MLKNFTDLKDKFGNSFDKELHVTRKGDKPKVYRNNLLRIRAGMAVEAERRSGNISADFVASVLDTEPTPELDNLIGSPLPSIKERNEDFIQDLLMENATETAEREQVKQEEQKQEERQQETKRIVNAENLKNEQLATLATTFFINSGTAFFGSKFKPDDKDEYLCLHGDFHSYLQSVPDFDIPPGIALAIGLGGYTIKHMKGKEEPDTFWHKTKNWFSKKKAQFKLNKDLTNAAEKAVKS